MSYVIHYHKNRNLPSNFLQEKYSKSISTRNISFVFQRTPIWCSSFRCIVAVAEAVGMCWVSSAAKSDSELSSIPTGATFLRNQLCCPVLCRKVGPLQLRIPFVCTTNKTIEKIDFI